MGLMNDNKGKDKRSKPKINRDKRVIIEKYLKDGLSKKEIARRMNRSYSSIKREIKRNGYYNWHGHWIYKVDTAQKMAKKRKKEPLRNLGGACPKFCVNL